MTVELVWPGKLDAAGKRSRPPVTGATLTTQELYGAGTHRLIEGDNLAALEALDDLRETVDLIVLDPPFATGGQFRLMTRVGVGHEGRPPPEIARPAYSDRFEGGVGGFIAMLDHRLQRLYALLAPHGSFYIHVDPTVGHAVKLLLDDVFGPQGFQREIVWRIGWVSGFKSRAKNWIRNHDLIFFYVKDPKRFTFNKQYTPHPPGYRRRDGKPPTGVGVPIDDVWNANEAEFGLRGIESLDSIQIKSFSTEKTGYATQKNVSLLRRIVAASSNPGDVVLDPFCGSGTTGVAAVGLGRRFVGCDINSDAIYLAKKRLLEVTPNVRIETVTGHQTSGDDKSTSVLVSIDHESGPKRWARDRHDELTSVSVSIERDADGVRLCGVVDHHEDRWPAALKAAILDWSDLVDGWAVGPMPRPGAPFCPRASSFRTHQRRAWSDRLDCDVAGPLLVRVYDVLYRVHDTQVP